MCVLFFVDLLRVQNLTTPPNLFHYCCTCVSHRNCYIRVELRLCSSYMILYPGPSNMSMTYSAMAVLFAPPRREGGEDPLSALVLCIHIPKYYPRCVNPAAVQRTLDVQALTHSLYHVGARLIRGYMHRHATNTPSHTIAVNNTRLYMLIQNNVILVAGLPLMGVLSRLACLA